MTHLTVRRATGLPLVIIGVFAGCAKQHLAFAKPGAFTADLQRDTNECLTNAVVNEGGRTLSPRVGHDGLVQCMEARGHRIGSR
jgi:hypothetical protein